MFVNWSKGMVDSVWFEVWKAEYGWLDIVSIQQKYGWQTRIWSVTLTSHHHYPVRQKVVSVCNSLVWPFPCLLFPISIADQHFSNLQCFKFVLKTNNQQQEQTNKKHALSPRHKFSSDPGVPGIRSMGPVRIRLSQKTERCSQKRCVQRSNPSHPSHGHLGAIFPLARTRWQKSSVLYRLWVLVASPNPYTHQW